MQCSSCLFHGRLSAVILLAGAVTRPSTALNLSLYPPLGFYVYVFVRSSFAATTVPFWQQQQHRGRRDPAIKQPLTARAVSSSSCKSLVTALWHNHLTPRVISFRRRNKNCLNSFPSAWTLLRGHRQQQPGSSIETLFHASWSLNAAKVDTTWRRPQLAA